MSKRETQKKDNTSAHRSDNEGGQEMQNNLACGTRDLPTGENPHDNDNAEEHNSDNDLHRMMEYLEQVFLDKGCASKDFLQRPSLKVFRKYMTDFVDVTTGQVPDKVCAVCARLVDHTDIAKNLFCGSEIFDVLCTDPGNEQVKLDSCGVTETGDVLVCKQCWPALQK